MGICDSSSIKHGILRGHICSPSILSIVNLWMSFNWAIVSSARLSGGVINSSNDSEKSVVIDSWVSAAPNAFGCGACDNSPLLFIRSASRSTPRFICLREDKNSGDLSAFRRSSKQDEFTVNVQVHSVVVPPVMGEQQFKIKWKRLT